MALRTGHGRGRGTPRVEVMPANELPMGVQGPVHVEAPEERRPGGKFAKGARTVQSMGGKARKESTALAHRLGLGQVADANAFAPYRKAAATFRRVHCSNLAQTVGGGLCGSGPSSMVASAALALAASRYLYDTANGDPAVLAQASRLANDSRQNLLAAHELAAKEATIRARAGQHTEVDDMVRAALARSREGGG